MFYTVIATADSAGLILQNPFANFGGMLPMSDFTAKSPGKSGTAIFYATNASAVGVDVHLDKFVFCYQKCELDSSQLGQRDFICSGTRTALQQAAEQCMSLSPDVIVMESTGIYWLPLYEALENAGFKQSQLIVLNAREVKAARGRKTDYTDAMRLTELGRSGRYRASFVPAKQYREYRLCFRAMQNTKRQKQRSVNQLHKLLCSVGAKASTVFSDIRGRAATAIITALAEGITGDALSALIAKSCARFHLKRTPEEISEALQCDRESPVWPAINSLLHIIESLEKSFKQQYTYLRNLVLKTDPALFKRLQSIPGISEMSAVGLICELGSDISGFRSAKQLCSWAGICPGNSESAGKRYSGKCAKGNKYVRGILIEAAHACARTKNCFLADKAQKLKERRGKRKATVALAHNLLRIIYAMYRDGTEFKNSPGTVLTEFRVEKFKKAASDLTKVQGIELEGTLVVKEEATGKISAKIEPSGQIRRKRKVTPE